MPARSQSLRCLLSLFPLLSVLLVPVQAAPAPVVQAAPAPVVQAAAPEVWRETGSLATARLNHTATLLPNGRVLVAGGDTNVGALSTAQLWNPTTGAWTTTGSMNYSRTGHTATLLADGRVLVTGGYGQASGPGMPGYLSSAEVYDPATGVWTAVGAMGGVRRGHTATLLADGRVLVAGGMTGTLSETASAELFDPATGTFTATGAMIGARKGHTATLLGDGQVLIFHGVIDPQDGPELLIEAAPAILAAHPGARFWMVGDGTAVPDLKARTRAAGLEDRFFFSGWVRQAEVARYISASDLGLVILPDVLSARQRSAPRRTRRTMPPPRGCACAPLRCARTARS